MYLCQQTQNMIYFGKSHKKSERTIVFTSTIMDIILGFKHQLNIIRFERREFFLTVSMPNPNYM